MSGKTRVLAAAAASAMAVAGLAGTAGPAQAAPGDKARPAVVAYAAGAWTAAPVHGQPPEYKCTINASATARLAWLRNPGEPTHLGLLVTTSSDIHNPYVFVGCTIRVNVDVLDANGLVLATVSNDAYAGAVLDPAGNNRSYTWVDEAPVEAQDLTTISGIEIRLQNVA
jgi:hypothetical protein